MDTRSWNIIKYIRLSGSQRTGETIERSYTNEELIVKFDLRFKVVSICHKGRKVEEFCVSPLAYEHEVVLKDTRILFCIMNQTDGRVTNKFRVRFESEAAITDFCSIINRHVKVHHFDNWRKSPACLSILETTLPASSNVSNVSESQQQKSQHSNSVISFIPQKFEQRSSSFVDDFNSQDSIDASAWLTNNLLNDTGYSQHSTTLLNDTTHSNLATNFNDDISFTKNSTFGNDGGSDLLKEKKEVLEIIGTEKTKNDVGTQTEESSLSMSSILQPKQQHLSSSPRAVNIYIENLVSADALQNVLQPFISREMAVESKKPQAVKKEKKPQKPKKPTIWTVMEDYDTTPERSLPKQRQSTKYPLRGAAETSIKEDPAVDDENTVEPCEKKMREQ